MAYTSRRNNGPVLRSGSPAAGRSSFASVTSAASSNTFFQNRSVASTPMMMTSSSSSSVRFNLFDNNRRSISPSRSISSVPVSKQLETPKRTCMCSPTSHPGSFRCSLHKKQTNTNSNSQTASYPSSRLNARRSAMTNSLVRIGTVEGGDLVKRALAALIRPSSHQQRRRGSFQARPSRLSVSYYGKTGWNMNEGIIYGLDYWRQNLREVTARLWRVLSMSLGVIQEARQSNVHTSSTYAYPLNIRYEKNKILRRYGAEDKFSRRHVTGKTCFLSSEISLNVVVLVDETKDENEEESIPTLTSKKTSRGPRCDQQKYSFWYKILDVYNAEAKKRGFVERTKNMLTGKWTPMNASVQKFNQLVSETLAHNKHKWNNPELTNARMNRFRVTDKEPEHFGDDVLPRPPGLQRIAKSQRSGSSSTASYGSSPMMYQEFMEEQYELDRKAKNASDRARERRAKEVNPCSKDCGGDASATNRHTRDGSGLRRYH
nr:hypothetical protein [Tanacetum cinerariifolium]